MFDENGNFIGFDLNQDGLTMGNNAIGTPGFQPIDFNENGFTSIDPITAGTGASEIGAPVVGPTRADIPAEYRTPDTLQGIEEIPLEEEADIPLDFDVEKPTDPAQTSSEAGGNVLEKAAGAASGVGQIVGGVTNIVMGARALKDVDIAGAEGAVRDAYATRPGLGTPVEFYNMQKEAYDQRLMAMRVEDINRGLATNVAAAQQYGARGLGATLAATAQAQRAQQQEVLQQQRLQTGALGTLAQAREREIQRREQRATFDIGMAFDQLKAEQAREQYARQQIAQGIVGTAAGVARTAVTFGAEQGAKVTPGEFSHDTNPIDIVQEGAKIGEMTGGEYIFNPQQAGKMAREAKKGNSPLHKFVRKTLNKFHKDAEKHEGK